MRLTSIVFLFSISRSNTVSITLSRGDLPQAMLGLTCLFTDLDTSMVRINITKVINYNKI